MVQTSIHTALKEDPHATPSKILNTVNSVIYDNIQKLGESKYMTITVFLDQGNGDFLHSGLHQDILIYRAAKKVVEPVETDGMWIGVMDDIGDILKTEQLSLNERDVMLLFTDGITEATDKAGKLFSTEYLAQILEESGERTAKEIEERILQALEPYTWDDDITFVVIKRDAVTQTAPLVS